MKLSSIKSKVIMSETLKILSASTIAELVKICQAVYCWKADITRNPKRRSILESFQRGKEESKGKKEPSPHNMSKSGQVGP